LLPFGPQSSIAFQATSAAIFNRLSGNQWQKVWTLTFGLLRFIVKLIFLAPTAIESNKKRWVVLNLIIDLIFARIQFATLPFIDDWLIMAALVAGSFGTLLWRYYSGFDRLQLLLGPLKAIPTASVPVIKILADPSRLPGAMLPTVGGEWLMQHHHLASKTPPVNGINSSSSASDGQPFIPANSSSVSNSQIQYPHSPPGEVQT
jgi:hypothetical protein